MTSHPGMYEYPSVGLAKYGFYTSVKPFVSMASRATIVYRRPCLIQYVCVVHVMAQFAVQLGGMALNLDGMGGHWSIYSNLHVCANS